ncbi:MAG: hypothetical protein ACYDAO_04400 [Thermoplasmataceae archaeon]
MKKPKILPDWILSDALKLINDGNYDLYPCTRCVKLVIDFKWQFKKQNYGDVAGTLIHIVNHMLKEHY